jgi:DNA-binding transcriptional LysR family regulator
MQVIEAIARFKSFSHAARELGISQSALSHTIANIEERMNITLFTRFKHCVEPTRFAFAFLKHFNAIRGTLEQTQCDLKGSSLIDIPKIKIQTDFRSNSLWLTPALTSLLKGRAKIIFDINLDLENCDKNLAIGSTDIVLSTLDHFPKGSELSTAFLGHYQNNFIVRYAHTLTNKSQLTIHDLINYPLIGDPIIVSAKNEFYKIPGRWGYYDQLQNIFYPAIRLTSLSDIIRIIRDTEAIGALPKEPLTDEMRKHQLTVLKVEDHTDHINQIYAVFRQSSFSSEALPALIEALKDSRG